MREAPGSIPGVSIFSFGDRERRSEPVWIGSFLESADTLLRTLPSRMRYKDDTCGVGTYAGTFHRLSRPTSHSPGHCSSERVWKHLTTPWDVPQSIALPPEQRVPRCLAAWFQVMLFHVCGQPLSMHGTSGLVAMTSASHAEGRQFDPGLVYIFYFGSGFARCRVPPPPPGHSTDG